MRSIEGRRVYWVCPLVEESESIDLAAAEERYAALQKRFGDTVALVHGRMRGPEKDRAMARFASGAARILVATTVIEVGVDVPEASVMVIEHAERFGLAQLHQLRGRIGRGAERSTCLLLYKAPLGDTAKARLAILRETDDGFRIAEEDLRLRGEGDVLGTRQSGMPGFRLARIEVHGKLLSAARDDAALVLNRDPKLGSAARRRAAPFALSVRARRSDQTVGRGLICPKPLSGSDPNRFGPGVPRVQNQTIRMMVPTSGIKANNSHQPLRSRSCSRRIATAKLGRNVARPKRPVVIWAPIT